ncbi:hypothetical protein M9Y10_014753 [Tritrichomonas musculus]|uniref:Uncharacterized protein n=1 Tax=Tritrichomonas musculus TaxID=1915356 RepID=A0ABR2L0E4_9EUKA
MLLAGRMVMHYGDSFEVCASDLRENKRSGLVTNDNGNVVYHWLTIHNATKTFVTFPSPVEQTTSRTDCGVPKVRAITFDKNDKFVEIDGKRLKLNRMRKLSKDGDAWLLEANVSFLAKGRHHLKLSGEEEEEFEFIFGRSSKMTKFK